MIPDAYEPLLSALLDSRPLRAVRYCLLLATAAGVGSWVSASRLSHTADLFSSYKSSWLASKGAYNRSASEILWFPFQYRYSTAGQDPSTAVSLVSVPNFHSVSIETFERIIYDDLRLSAISADSVAIPDDPSALKTFLAANRDLGEVTVPAPEPASVDEFDEPEFANSLVGLSDFRLLSDTEVLDLVDMDRTRILESIIRTVPELSLHHPA
jgi:hypothetical protein